MSLYDVLGVGPSASADELHRAYRERARALHPDRHPDASPTARRAAESQMRELNNAWRVLSDPAGRRDYDRTLLPPAEPRPPVEAVPRREEPDVPYDSPGVAWLARVVPLIVLLAVLGFIFVFTAFALNDPDDERSPVAEVGDCVRVSGGHVSEIVACGQPNDGEVAHAIDRDGSCPNDERRVDGSDGSSALCLQVP